MLTKDDLILVRTEGNSKLRLNYRAEATQLCHYIIISHNKQRWNNYQSEIVSNLISLTYWTQFGISLGIRDENDTMTPLEIPFLPIPASRIGLTKHVSYSKVFPTYKINSCPKTLLLEWMQPCPFCWNGVSCLIFTTVVSLKFPLPFHANSGTLFCWHGGQFADMKYSSVLIRCTTLKQAWAHWHLNHSCLCKLFKLVQFHLTILFTFETNFQI